MLIVADDAALVHRHDPAAYRINNRLVVSGEEDGRAEVIDLFQDLDDVVRVDGVEVACRLVGQEARRAG